MNPGYEERKDLFNLYHLLNHLNIFDSSYLSSVQQVIKRYTYQQPLPWKGRMLANFSKGLMVFIRLRDELLAPRQVG